MLSESSDLVRTLILEHPEMWGEDSPYGRALTPQRFGRMLATSMMGGLAMAAAMSAALR